MEISSKSELKYYWVALSWLISSNRFYGIQVVIKSYELYKFLCGHLIFICKLKEEMKHGNVR
jgi:hypothetical protein